MSHSFGRSPSICFIFDSNWILVLLFHEEAKNLSHSSRLYLNYVIVCWRLVFPFFNFNLNSVPSPILLKHRLTFTHHNFIRYLARKYFKDSNFHIDYSHYEDLLKIEPIHQRRSLKDVSFVIKSFNGDTDSSSYLHLFNLHAPQRTFREHTTFRPSTCNSVSNRLMRSFNEHVNDYDILSSKYSKWRTKELIMKKKTN